MSDIAGILQLEVGSLPEKVQMLRAFLFQDIEVYDIEDQMTIPLQKERMERIILHLSRFHFP